jgi:hypothetical protein
MKLNSFVQKVVKALDIAVHQHPHAPAKQKPVAKADGFDVARKAPVDLGKQPGASAASDADFVRGLYKDLLTREPDAGGFQAHLNGLATGMSRDQIRDVFLNSPEYREKQAAAAAGPAAPTTDTAATPAGASPNRPLGPVPLEGYDAGKLNDFSHQTVKYQFGRVATHYPLDSVKDKASAEALLKKMQPDLEAAGLKIHEIKGDKIRVDTPLGQEWVDVIRGAGSGNPGFWWGSEGKAIPGTEGSATPSAPSGTSGPGAPLSTVPMLPEYATAPIDTSSPDAAARSAAQWVKDTYPQLFGKGDDRQVAMQVMAHVIGALRAHGYDSTRVVNHPDRPMTDGFRYGSDAVVLNGNIYDVYGSFGEPGKSNVQALNVGPYEAGRLRE